MFNGTLVTPATIVVAVKAYIGLVTTSLTGLEACLCMVWTLADLEKSKGGGSQPQGDGY